MTARAIPTDGRPRLTQLDERVLEHVPAGSPGIRARAIVERLNYPRGRRPHVVSKGITDLDEVRGILRGLEHLGQVRQTAGWWTRA